MTPKLSLKIKFLALVLGAFLTAVEISNYRNTQLAQLYSTAVSRTSDSLAAESAVRKLNSYRGSAPQDLLVKMATSNQDFPDRRQDLAIELLIADGDPHLTSRVAVLLQPSVGLARREAVATALQNAVCNEECTRFVLHYLERRWSGFGIQEEITNVAAHFDVGPEIERKQSQIVEKLDRTLAINSRSTISVLRNTYSLGNPVPSGFSLYLLQSVPLKEACPFLEASENNLMDSSKSAELEKTLRELGCPPTS